MNTLELISNAKFYTRTPQLDETALATEVDDALTRPFWMKQLDVSQDVIHAKVLQSYQEFFTHSESKAYAAGTNEYSLPVNSVQVQMIERVGTYRNEDLHPILINKKNDYQTYGNTQYPQFFYIYGKNYGVVDAGTAGTAQIFYIRKLPRISYATVTCPTTTTVVWAAAPTLGVLDDRDDYYNGATIRFVSATTGAGQRATVTDYVASTRTMTIAAPATPLTGTIVAEIVCEIPEEHHLCVSMFMAMLGQVSDNQEIKPGLKEIYQEALSNMLNGIVPRQAVESDHVHNPYR